MRRAGVKKLIRIVRSYLRSAGKARENVGVGVCVCVCLLAGRGAGNGARQHTRLD